MTEAASNPIAEPYKRWSGAEIFDAVVVGSGIGGLCAAIVQSAKERAKSAGRAAPSDIHATAVTSSAT